MTDDYLNLRTWSKLFNDHKSIPCLVVDENGQTVEQRN